MTATQAGRAVFLDRDGVINDDWYNPATGAWESPVRPEDFILRAGVIKALTRLQAAGYLLILVSNQPNVALGKCDFAALEAVHGRFEALLDRAGIRFAAFNYAYGHPDAVVPEWGAPALFNRKPEPWFLLQDRDRFGLDLAGCWMVGDRDTDIQCGRRAGTRTIQVVNPHAGAKAGKANPDHHVPGLPEAAAVILGVDAGPRS